jgi:transcriptional regulator with XRE-family HTH domain
MIGRPEVLKLMDSRAWGQAELANAAGVTQSTVSRWVRGAVPGPRHQEVLAALLADNKDGAARAAPEGAPAVRTLGDSPLSSEQVRVLVEIVERYLSAYHPQSAQRWREATQQADPFPLDIPISPADRGRLLEDAEHQGHRARIRSKRQTD